ncbi:hypothetical protein H2200_002476 [Cladophialophora chaetospira]|uniref:Uncharacterized protein n=1 Tax=Cladophialophora chaetospira TaxID=386627 RepID=A0AA38XIY2_9EURO|nr:hypothetical protein H2200_002476 [Cladophialophora chaetospira]
MAPEVTQPAAIRDNQLPTFLSLPAEVRMNIYKILYEEIEIYCKHEDYWEDLKVNEIGRRWKGEKYWYSLRYCSALLFACRQIYSEAKPVVDAAPITVSGKEHGRFRSSDFPDTWNVRSRISKLIMPNEVFTLNNKFLNGRRYPGTLPFDYNFRKPGKCPNLQTVWVRKLDSQDHSYSENYDNVIYPITVLPTIYACLACQVEPAGYRSICKMRQTFKSIGGLKPSKGFRPGEIDMMDTCGWPTYRAQDFGDPVAEWEAFEDRFEVVIVWDKNGMRIEGLPNLKDRWWWKEWSKYCFSTAESSEADNNLRLKVFWADLHDGWKPKWFSSKDLDMTRSLL